MINKTFNDYLKMTEENGIPKSYLDSATPEELSKIYYNEEQLIPESYFEELFKNGVNCCDCGKPLDKGEIKAYRYSGISDPKDMECFLCFYKNNLEEGETF